MIEARKQFRFLLHAVVAGMKHDEIEYLTKRIVKADPPIFEMPELINVTDDKVLGVFASARGALNFAQLIIKNAKTKNVQLSLHAGPVSLHQSGDASSVDGTAVSEIINMSHHALPGLMYSSELVAAILVLERQDLLFHPVGRIEVGDKKDLELYTVDLLP